MTKKCEKCGFESDENILIRDVFLCDICKHFSPELESEFRTYLDEKVSKEAIVSFRKYYRKPGETQKKGMISKASEGKPMSRPAFGYKLENNELIQAENYKEVEEIYEEFLTSNISLTQLAKKHSFSVNGLKKILSNFTYVGKVKFNGQIHQGTHKPLISNTLFNHVQNKLKGLNIKQE